MDTLLETKKIADEMLLEFKEKIAALSQRKNNIVLKVTNDIETRKRKEKEETV